MVTAGSDGMSLSDKTDSHPLAHSVYTDKCICWQYKYRRENQFLSHDQFLGHELFSIQKGMKYTFLRYQMKP